MCNVIQPNRSLTETVAHVGSVEGRNTNVSDHRLDRAYTHLLDQVAVASPALWRYTERKYTVPILSIHLY